jgi:hypothetical protein
MLDVGPALLQLFRDEDDEFPNAYGNGFAIAPGIVATCAHLVAGATRIYSCMRSSPHYLQFELICKEDVADIALLRMTLPSTHTIPFLSFAPDEEITAGMDVLCAARFHAGHARGQFPGREIEWRVRGKLLRFLELKDGFKGVALSAVAAHGCSGAPVLNSDHRVCGMVARRDEGTGNVAAVHVGTIRGLLSQYVPSLVAP